MEPGVLWISGNNYKLKRDACSLLESKDVPFNIRILDSMCQSLSGILVPTTAHGLFIWDIDINPSVEAFRIHVDTVSPDTISNHIDVFIASYHEDKVSRFLETLSCMVGPWLTLSSACCLEEVLGQKIARGQYSKPFAVSALNYFQPVSRIEYEWPNLRRGLTTSGNVVLHTKLVWYLKQHTGWAEKNICESLYILHARGRIICTAFLPYPRGKFSYGATDTVLLLDPKMFAYVQGICKDILLGQPHMSHTCLGPLETHLRRCSRAAILPTSYCWLEVQTRNLDDLGRVWLHLVDGVLSVCPKTISVSDTVIEARVVGSISSQLKMVKHVSDTTYQIVLEAYGAPQICTNTTVWRLLHHVHQNSATKKRLVCVTAKCKCRLLASRVYMFENKVIEQHQRPLYQWCRECNTVVWSTLNPLLTFQCLNRKSAGDDPFTVASTEVKVAESADEYPSDMLSCALLCGKFGRPHSNSIDFCNWVSTDWVAVVFAGMVYTSPNGIIRCLLPGCVLGTMLPGYMQDAVFMAYVCCAHEPHIIVDICWPVDFSTARSLWSINGEWQMCLWSVIEKMGCNITVKYSNGVARQHQWHVTIQQDQVAVIYNVLMRYSCDHLAPKTAVDSVWTTHTVYLRPSPRHPVFGDSAWLCSAHSQKLRRYAGLSAVLASLDNVVDMAMCNDVVARIMRCTTLHVRVNGLNLTAAIQQATATLRSDGLLLRATETTDTMRVSFFLPGDAWVELDATLSDSLLSLTVHHTGWPWYAFLKCMNFILATPGALHTEIANVVCECCNEQLYAELSPKRFSIANLLCLSKPNVCSTASLCRHCNCCMPAGFIDILKRLEGVCWKSSHHLTLWRELPTSSACDAVAFIRRVVTHGSSFKFVNLPSELIIVPSQLIDVSMPIAWHVGIMCTGCLSTRHPHPTAHIILVEGMSERCQLGQTLLQCDYAYHVLLWSAIQQLVLLQSSGSTGLQQSRLDVYSVGRYSSSGRARNTVLLDHRICSFVLQQLHSVPSHERWTIHDSACSVAEKYQNVLQLLAPRQHVRLLQHCETQELVWACVDSDEYLHEFDSVVRCAASAKAVGFFITCITSPFAALFKYLRYDCHCTQCSTSMSMGMSGWVCFKIVDEYATMRASASLTMLNQWRRAFHGTTPSAINSILHGQFAAGGTKNVHGDLVPRRNTLGTSSKPVVYLSPDLNYASLFSEMFTCLGHGANPCIFVLEVSVAPGAWTTQAETLGLRQNPHLDAQDFSCPLSQIEWLVDQPHKIVLRNVWVHNGPVHPMYKLRNMTAVNSV